MDQGLVILGADGQPTIFPMSSRDDVFAKALLDLDGITLQDALRAAHGHSERILCRCGYSDHRHLQMEAVCAGGKMRADRRSIFDEHHPDCFFVISSPEEKLEHRDPSISIFSAPVQRTSTIGVGTNSGSGGAWTPYETYCRRMLSRGYTHAFCEVNVLADRFENMRRPHARDVLMGIHTVIETTVMRSAQNGYIGAAEMGGRLVFGIIEQEIPEWCAAAPEHLLVTRLVWLWDGQVLRSRPVQVPAGLLAACHRGVSIFGKHHVPPPYVFVAVVERSGVVRRLYTHAICFDGVDWSYCRSKAERGFQNYLIHLGRVYYAALDGMGDYADILPPHLQIVPTTNDRPWPFKPDLVTYHPRKPRIIEVRGFKKGTLTDYDQLMDRKPDAYRKFIGPGRASYLEVNGWDFADRDLSRAPSLGGTAVLRRLWLPELAETTEPRD